jgi:hypothetical protein
VCPRALDSNCAPGKFLLCLWSWAGAGDSGNEGADALLNNLARGQTTAAERLKSWAAGMQLGMKAFQPLG